MQEDGTVETFTVFTPQGPVSFRGAEIETPVQMQSAGGILTIKVVEKNGGKVHHYWGCPATMDIVPSAIVLATHKRPGNLL